MVPRVSFAYHFLAIVQYTRHFEKRCAKMVNPNYKMCTDCTCVQGEQDKNNYTISIAFLQLKKKVFSKD